MGADAVTTGLAQLTLQPGSKITVNADDSGTKVTKLVIKVFQVRPETRPAVSPILLRGG